MTLTARQKELVRRARGIPDYDWERDGVVLCAECGAKLNPQRALVVHGKTYGDTCGLRLLDELGAEERGR